jgi:hypothetical protein
VRDVAGVVAEALAEAARGCGVGGTAGGGDGARVTGAGVADARPAVGGVTDAPVSRDGTAAALAADAEGPVSGAVRGGAAARVAGAGAAAAPRGGAAARASVTADRAPSPAFCALGGSGETRGGGAGAGGGVACASGVTGVTPAAFGAEAFPSTTDGVMAPGKRLAGVPVAMGSATCEAGRSVVPDHPGPKGIAATATTAAATKAPANHTRGERATAGGGVRLSSPLACGSACSGSGADDSGSSVSVECGSSSD